MRRSLSFFRDTQILKVSRLKVPCALAALTVLAREHTDCTGFKSEGPLCSSGAHCPYSGTRSFSRRQRCSPVLYRQQHLQKLVHCQGYLCIHFFWPTSFMWNVRCGVVAGSMWLSCVSGRNVSRLQALQACKNEVYLLPKQLDEIEVILHFHALGAVLIVLTREHIMAVPRLKDLSRVSTTVNVDSVVDGSGWLSCVSGRKHSCLRSASLFPQRVTSTTSLFGPHGYGRCARVFIAEAEASCLRSASLFLQGVTSTSLSTWKPVLVRRSLSLFRN